MTMGMGIKWRLYTTCEVCGGMVVLMTSAVGNDVYGEGRGGLLRGRRSRACGRGSEEAKAM